MDSGENASRGATRLRRPVAPRLASAQGLLLVGHGTRDPRGLDEFRATARLVSDRLPDVSVEPCFLELAEPGIAEAVRRLVDRGVRQIVVAPLLLFAAGHAKRDIPSAVEAVVRYYPDLEVRNSLHLGVHPKLVQASANRFRSALNNFDSPPRVGEAMLLLVGRGSYDPTATAEMLAFAAARVQLTPVKQMAVGFVAMAKPTIQESLAELLEFDSSEKGARIPDNLGTHWPVHLIVQPHLLFHGELLSTIHQDVARCQEYFSQRGNTTTCWHIADHLGADSLVAEAIIDLYLQAR